MRTDLRDRLTDLATHTPPASAPSDLWARGVRRRRATRIGRAAVAAVLVAMIGLGGWTWHAARPVRPVDSHGTPHLPDRFFYDVSPWTWPFDGPPGPLVTVFPHVRASVWHADTNGVVGVTAASGSYGFLDLPGDAVLSGAVSHSLALSPDGRRLAFWVTGETSGARNTEEEDGHTITGVAVYDTVTGDVRESHVATVHGLEPRALMFTDDSTLVVSYGQIQGADGTETATTSSFGATLAWDVGSGNRPHVLAADMHADARPWWLFDSDVARATGGELVMPDRYPHSWATADPATRGSLAAFRTDRICDLLVLSPDHRRAIGVLGHDRESGPLAVAGLRPRTTLQRLPLGHRWYRPLAWLDRDHVAVLERAVVHDPVAGDHVSGRIALVDLATRSVRPLVADFGTNGSNESDAWVATGLLQAPSMHAHAPPGPPDLRLRMIWLAVAAGVAVLVGAAVLRRSRGPRP